MLEYGLMTGSKEMKFDRSWFKLSLYISNPSFIYTVLMLFSTDVVDPKYADGVGLCRAATCSVVKHELNRVTGQICLDRLYGTESDWL